MQEGPEWIGAVSFGNSNEWIARYGGGTWSKKHTEGLESQTNNDS